MKKLLLTLTLLLTLGFAASAADYSDELTAANFSGMSYTASKTYTGDASGATYLAQAYSNSGFQMRTSKAGTGIKNTTTLEGYTIESVEITFSRAGGGVEIHAADALSPKLLSTGYRPLLPPLALLLLSLWKMVLSFLPVRQSR